MGKDTKIQWTATVRADGTVVPGYTFNSWRGCADHSAGCLNCYAKKWAKRNPKMFGTWGSEAKGGVRVVAAESGWQDTRKWDRDAKAAGERHRVFCGSLMDVLEDWQGPMVDNQGRQLFEVQPWHLEQPDNLVWSHGADESNPLTMNAVRMRLAWQMWATPNLDWLLVTKRIENYERFWIKNPCVLPTNYWIGVTIEDRKAAATRIPIMRDLPTPAYFGKRSAPIRFLSIEPLLEDLGTLNLTGIDWVILGGESGPNARPCDIAWIRSIVQQCKNAGVPCFVKQYGSRPIQDSGRTFDSITQWVNKARTWIDSTHVLIDSQQRICRNGGDMNRADKDGAFPVHIYAPIKLKGPHGGDPSEWPEQFPREFPSV